MGFFSYTCAKTNLPYLVSSDWEGHPFSEAVVIHEDGTVADAPSDLRDLRDDIEAGRAKIVLKGYYKPETDTFASLGVSRNDPGQGHFHKKAFLKKLLEIGPFVSYEGYVLAIEGALPVGAASKMTAGMCKTLMAAERSLQKAVAEARVRDLFPEVLPAGGKVDPYWFIKVKLSKNVLEVGCIMPDGMTSRSLGKMAMAEDGTVTPSFEEMAERIVSGNQPKQVIDITFVRDDRSVAQVYRLDTGAGERLFVVNDPDKDCALLYRDSRAVMKAYGIDETNYFVSAQLDNYKPEEVPSTIDIDVKPDFGGFFGADEEEADSLPSPFRH